MNLIKEEACKIIDNLPENASFEDAIEALLIRAKIENAENDIREGKTFSNEEAKKRLKR